MDTLRKCYKSCILGIGVFVLGGSNVLVGQASIGSLLPRPKLKQGVGGVKFA